MNGCLFSLWTAPSEAMYRHMKIDVNAYHDRGGQIYSRAILTLFLANFSDQPGSPAHRAAQTNNLPMIAHVGRQRMLTEEQLKRAKDPNASIPTSATFHLQNSPEYDLELLETRGGVMPVRLSGPSNAAVAAVSDEALEQHLGALWEQAEPEQEVTMRVLSTTVRAACEFNTLRFDSSLSQARGTRHVVVAVPPAPLVGAGGGAAPPTYTRRVFRVDQFISVQVEVESWERLQPEGFIHTVAVGRYYPAAAAGNFNGKLVVSAPLADGANAAPDLVFPGRFLTRAVLSPVRADPYNAADQLVNDFL